MKRLGSLLVFLGSACAFFAGLVYWMANSSHQEAERLRQRGKYCEVEVLEKHVSSPGDGTSTFYYVDIKPTVQAPERQRITCKVGHTTYEQLQAGQRLMAWVQGTDALLDYGPRNSAFVARTMRLVCVGSVLVFVAGVALKVAIWKRKRAGS